MSRRHWRQRVADMIEAIREIQILSANRSAADLARDDTTFKAILYNFIILGEAARNIPDDIGAAAPGIDWPGMRAMRNVVTHVYFGVDPARVHATIVQDLPQTLTALERLLLLRDDGSDQNAEGDHPV